MVQSFVWHAQRSPIACVTVRFWVACHQFLGIAKWRGYRTCFCMAFCWLLFPFHFILITFFAVCIANFHPIILHILAYALTALKNSSVFFFILTIPTLWNFSSAIQPSLCWIFLPYLSTVASYSMISFSDIHYGFAVSFLFPMPTSIDVSQPFALIILFFRFSWVLAAFISLLNFYLRSPGVPVSFEKSSDDVFIVIIVSF